jgi:hypothetical protein
MKVNKGCLLLITALRKTDMYIKCIYTSGGCYQFYIFLKKLYPQSVPYINKDKNHIVTKIDGRLYDINGMVLKRDEGLYQPLKASELNMAKRWSFHKNNLLKLIDCPACDEPICV